MIQGLSGDAPHSRSHMVISRLRDLEFAAARARILDNILRMQVTKSQSKARTDSTGPSFLMEKPVPDFDTQDSSILLAINSRFRPSLVGC
jgi:hypothetical protein